MTRVLVTGAAGFIGGHLARTLGRRGHQVRGLVRPGTSTEALAQAGVEPVPGDVTRPADLAAAVDDVEVVYHLAGCTRALNQAKYRQVNTLGTWNIAAACAARAAPPTLVVVSSLAAAGPTSGRPLVETDRPHPVSEYGRSKLAAEQALGRFAARVPITIVRPPLIFGPRDTTGLLMFQMVARLRVHLTPTVGRPRYSVLHVADLVEAIMLAGARGRRLEPAGLDGAATGIYFVAAETVTFPDLGQYIAEALGRRFVVRWFIASPFVWMAAGFGEIAGRVTGQPVYLNTDKACEATSSGWVCSSKRAADELGFRPAADLRTRLRETVDDYRRDGWL